MAKTYSSFFFNFPQHVSPSTPPPPPPPPLPTRAQSSSAPTPYRSFLSLDDDPSVTSSRPSRRTRQLRHELPAIDTRHLDPRASTLDRALPRPKPAPVSTLPAVPASAPPTHTRYPRGLPPPTPRPNTSPAHHKQRKCTLTTKTMTTTTTPAPKYLHVAPPPMRPPRPPYSPFDTPLSPISPRSPAAHPHRLLPQPPVRVKTRQRPVSMASASSVSTHHRIFNRTDALARLEGRVPRSATLPYSFVQPSPAPPPPPPPPPPFGMTTASSSPSPSPSPSPRLPQYSPPPYSPPIEMQRVKSAAPVLATKSFMPFSDGEDSDDESDEVGGGGLAGLGVRLNAGLRLSSDSEAGRDDDDDEEEEEDDAGEKVLGGRRKDAHRTTIASWYVGPPETVPKNFMDFGDVDVDVDVDVDIDVDVDVDVDGDVYDLYVAWKEYMRG